MWFRQSFIMDVTIDVTEVVRTSVVASFACTTPQATTETNGRPLVETRIYFHIIFETIQTIMPLSNIPVVEEKKHLHIQPLKLKKGHVLRKVFKEIKTEAAMLVSSARSLVLDGDDDSSRGEDDLLPVGPVRPSRR
jgi:hypothetical protein